MPLVPRYVGKARSVPPSSPSRKQQSRRRCAVKIERGAVVHAYAEYGAAPFAQTVAYVAKMITIPATLVGGSIDEPDAVVGFGRVFSGTLREGMRIHVLNARCCSLIDTSCAQQCNGARHSIHRRLTRLAASIAAKDKP